jgi:WD40 repeat protein
MRFSLRRFSLRTLLLAVLLIGSAGGLYYRWEPWACVHVLGGHSLEVMPCFNKDYSKIVTSDTRGPKKAAVWDLNSGMELMSIPIKNDVDYASYRCNEKLLSIWEDRLVDAETGKDLFGTDVIEIIIEESDRRAVVRDQAGRSELWDLNSRTKLVRLDFISPSSRCVTFSKDGRRLAVDGKVWEVESQSLVAGETESGNVFFPNVHSRPTPFDFHVYGGK